MLMLWHYSFSCYAHASIQVTKMPQCLHIMVEMELLSETDTYNDSNSNYFHIPIIWVLTD